MPNVPNLLIPTPPANAILIRVTERAFFRECRRKWSFMYESGLEPKAGMEARTFGTAVHEFLAAFYGCKGNKNLLPRLSKNIPTEMRTLFYSMVTNYPKWSWEADRGLRIVTINGKPAVETTLYAPIPGLDNVWLQGTCDLLCVDAEGQLIVIDHKTYREFLTPQKLDFDDQLIAYSWMLKQHGYTVRTGIYNQLLKCEPEVPDLLKSGKLSTKDSLRGATTREVYQEAITRHNLPHEEYTAFLDSLPPMELFRREPIRFNGSSWREFETNLIGLARDLTNPKMECYPSPSWGCPSCDYSLLCKVKSNGGDTTALEKEFYNYRKENLKHRLNVLTQKG